MDEQLAQKGLTRVEKDADLKVGSHAIFHQEKGVNLSALGTEGGPWGGWDRAQLWARLLPSNSVCC